MAHTHPVTDVDTHFKIDGATRTVKNVSDTKTMLVQFDHYSEKFTFEVPRFVDEHDLSLCNCVRVHYINIDKSKRTENKGVSPVDDFGVCPEDDNLVTCSWLVPRNATQLVGSLHFVIQFACTEGEELLYSWNTARHTAVTIIDGIDAGQEIVNDNSDILTKWENELRANQIMKIEQTTFSTEDNGENVWTVTFGDERTQQLVVRNGSKGSTGDVGSIETVQGHQLHFFVGTKAEYNALTPEQKQNLFAIFTDDNINKSSFRGNGTGFMYEFANSTDANNLTGEGHYFIQLGVNLPIAQGQAHGFLDIEWYNGTNFTPNGVEECVVKQTFRPWNTNDIYCRTYKAVESAWTPWEKVNASVKYNVEVVFSMRFLAHPKTNVWSTEPVCMSFISDTKILEQSYTAVKNAFINTYKDFKDIRVPVSSESSYIIFESVSINDSNELRFRASGLGFNEDTDLVYFDRKIFDANDSTKVSSISVSSMRQTPLV